MRTVVSIDGGGIRGLAAAMVLEEIEKRLQKELNDSTFRFIRNVDLIAGTSSGGLISLLLASPHDYSSAEVRNFYIDHRTSIFPKVSMLRNALTWVHGDKYSPEPLAVLLKKFLKNTLMSSMSTNILVTSYDLRQSKPVFFTKNDPKNQSKAFLAREVGRATSAAPTYFPPMMMSSLDASKVMTCVDGGLFANNPAMCAATEAMKLFKCDPEEIQLISIGTGKVIDRETEEPGCKIGWISPLIDNMFDSSSDVVDHQCKNMLDHYIRFQFPLIPTKKNAFALDDVSHESIEAIMNTVQTYLSDSHEVLDQAVAWLKDRGSVS